MKPTSYNTMPCALYGHNYIVTKEYLDRTSELTCKHCQVKLKTNASGDFMETINPSKDVQNILRKLYQLNLKSAKFNLNIG
ncbi:hypothetical protein [Winogradskyella flava]|uniref:Uncharacterized protein n=1 Tax=Winogradskyella flava TaxID=1884876 RepID=A0A842IRD5_9FLAO|nr:hypothetical protein [Winogradskyella flava]MBC2844017.1 hypothetical protein [Winogradskyella flava]